MENEISSIFPPQPDDQAPVDDRLPSRGTRMRTQDIPEPEIEEQPPHVPIHQPQPSYYYGPPPPAEMPLNPPPPQYPNDGKWDPFSSIGTTAWVVMALAFIIGFIVGRMK